MYIMVLTLYITVNPSPNVHVLSRSFRGCPRVQRPNPLMFLDLSNAFPTSPQLALASQPSYLALLTSQAASRPFLALACPWFVA